MPLTRQLGTARACGGMAVPDQPFPKQAFSSKVRTARACGGTAVRDTPSSILQKKNPSSSSFKHHNFFHLSTSLSKPP